MGGCRGPEPLSCAGRPGRGGRMKTVNLLPNWYCVQKRQQKNLHVHLLLMMAMGALMVGWSFIGHQRVAALETKRGDLDVRLAQVGDPDKELTKQNIELQRLENLQLAYR